MNVLLLPDLKQCSTLLFILRCLWKPMQKLYLFMRILYSIYRTAVIRTAYMHGDFKNNHNRFINSTYYYRISEKYCSIISLLFRLTFPSSAFCLSFPYCYFVSRHHVSFDSYVLITLRMVTLHDQFACAVCVNLYIYCLVDVL